MGALVTSALVTGVLVTGALVTGVLVTGALALVEACIKSILTGGVAMGFCGL